MNGAIFLPAVVLWYLTFCSKEDAQLTIDLLAMHCALPALYRFNQLIIWQESSGHPLRPSQVNAQNVLRSW